MKRPSAPDYRHDRVRWAGLIRDIHETAALPHENARRDLAERCAEARNTWLTAAAYPDGLIFPLMATAGLAWARSVEGEPRSRLLGVMLETASLADEALARANTVAAPVMPAHPLTARLPYRDAD